MKKLLFILVTIFSICFLFGCGADSGETSNGSDGITPQIRINDVTSYWEVSYDNGVTWESLYIRAIGQEGKMPSLRVNDDNYWEVSYDNGSTWITLTAKATGETGDKGKDGITPTVEIDENGYWVINGNITEVKATGIDGQNGKDGITPTVEINENGYWVINGNITKVKATGTDGQNGKDGITPTISISAEGYWVINDMVTEVKAKGADGANGTTPTVEINEDGYWVINGNVTSVNAKGTSGTNGKDGKTPKLRINDATNYWEVSYDDGETWESLNVIAVAKTYVPAIFYDYDGTKLYEFYYEYGTDIAYDGPTPTREQEADGTTVYNYEFSGWDNSLENITKPMAYVAQYSVTSFTGYKVTFKDESDNVLYEHYYKKGSNVVYPLAQPFSYDDTNAYQFVCWSEDLTGLSKDMTVTPVMATISRTQCGEYPQSLVTDSSIISELDKIEEVDDKGYKSYGGNKYLAYSGGAYIDDEGNEVSEGTHYYKVEPIQWRSLSYDSSKSELFVITQYIIDFQPFGTYYRGTSEKTELGGATATVYANNYMYSEIRTWLNTTFLNNAFDSTSLIKNSTQYNKQTENALYGCPTTYDKVYIIASDTTTSSYYFDSTNLNKDRMAETTEYARAIWAKNGAIAELSNTYMTRTASSSSEVHTIDITNQGSITSNYHIGYAKGIRPVLSFTISIDE